MARLSQRLYNFFGGIFSRRFSLQYLYINAHILYFLFISLIGGMIIQLIEGSGNSYVDSAFSGFSASCVTGLITVDFSVYDLASKLIVFFLILLGSTSLGACYPILFRQYFIRKFYRQLKKQDPPAGNPTTLTRQPTVRLSQMRPSLDTGSQISDGKSIDDMDIDPGCLEGNIEYRALKKLLRIVVLYYFIVQLTGFVILSIYGRYRESVYARLQSLDIHPTWFGAFFSVSSYNNAGFALFNDSFIGLQTDTVVLLTSAALIFLGNTGFAVCLYTIVFLCERYCREKAPYRYLLLFPRKCCTHLFGRSTCIFLFAMWCTMTLVQLIFHLSLDHKDPSISALPFHDKLLMFFYQSVSTRTAGFNVIDLRILDQGSIIVTIFMMYAASYPIIMSIRSSQAADLAQSMVPIGREPDSSVQTQFKSIATSLVARDVSLIYLSILMICIAESESIMTDPSNYSVIAVIFEVISAYGTVGLSLGVGGTVVSYSGKLTKFSRIVIIFVMMLGRHRTMPSNLDSAIDLRPSLPVSTDNLNTHFEIVSSPRGVRRAPRAFDVRLHPPQVHNDHGIDRGNSLQSNISVSSSTSELGQKAGPNGKPNSVASSRASSITGEGLDHPPTIDHREIICDETPISVSEIDREPSSSIQGPVSESGASGSSSSSSAAVAPAADLRSRNPTVYCSDISIRVE